MEKEEIAAIAQLLSAMKDSAQKLEEMIRLKDSEQTNIAKKEIMHFQQELEKLLRQ